MGAWRNLAEPAPRRRSPVKREVYREFCQDDERNRYTVIVWPDWPGSATSYALEDGTPVHYEDDCVFSLPSGTMISRCAD